MKNGLREVQKVFPCLIKKMPNEKTTVVKSSPPQKNETERTVSSSIPGYKEMEEGLEKDKAGKHLEAMVLYERAGELGNKAGFINMGNCYMFEKGVKQGWEKCMKGIEMYEKCGRIDDDEIEDIKELSNDHFVCEKELKLYGLLFNDNDDVSF